MKPLTAEEQREAEDRAIIALARFNIRLAAAEADLDAIEGKL